MQILYLLVPLSLLFMVGAIWGIRYAIRSHQFDDLDAAGARIILEDREYQRQFLQDQQGTALPESHSESSVAPDSATDPKPHD